MDTGAQVNSFDISFCKKYHLKPLAEARNMKLPVLVNPNGSRLKNHGIFLISFHVTDVTSQTGCA